jgi:hypothetical protein
VDIDFLFFWKLLLCQCCLFAYWIWFKCYFLASKIDRRIYSYFCIVNKLTLNKILLLKYCCNILSFYFVKEKCWTWYPLCEILSLFLFNEILKIEFLGDARKFIFKYLSDRSLVCAWIIFGLYCYHYGACLYICLSDYLFLL